jgi:hypothetical protein
VIRQGLTVALAIALMAVPARALAAEPPIGADGVSLTSMRDVADGAAVTFEGEVISEVMRGDGGHVWVNVLSAGVGIGVWMPADLAEELRTFGDWHHTGDTVRVTGVLNHACDRHGGDLDVHASAVQVLTYGSERERQPQWWKAAAGLGGLVVAYAGLRRLRRQEERSRT